MLTSAAMRSWVLVVAWVVAALLVDPRADVPLIDDWTYAMSVERLLAGGGFQVAAWSSTFPPAQIFWGTLFAWVAGFSYTVLRLSTLVAAVLGTLAFHASLRTVGFSASRALVGALTLLVYPVAFVLSFTFMTDVPMLTTMLASLWALAHAFGEDRHAVRWLIVGLVLSLVAFLIRPVAVALPVAVLVTVAVRRVPRRSLTVVLTLATLTLMAASVVVARPYWHDPTQGQGGLAYRLERLRWVFEVSPWIYAEALLSMLAHLGLAALPALVAAAAPIRRWPLRTVLALGVAAVGVSCVAPQQVAALKPYATWSVRELGGARPLLAGALPINATHYLLGLVATAIGLVAASELLARAVRALRPDGALRSPQGTCTLAFGGVSAALCFVLWFFYDRYYLPLVPVAIVLALVPERRGDEAREDASSLRHSWAAAALLVALLALDVTGARDMLAYARAVDAALARLIAAGVARHDVDAGYAENGWHLYAHPENLPAGANVDRDVPHVTAAPVMPYVIANAPLPDYVVRERLPVASVWATPRHVYVLARAENARDSTLDTSRVAPR